MAGGYVRGKEGRMEGAGGRKGKEGREAGRERSLCSSQI